MGHGQCSSSERDGGQGVGKKTVERLRSSVSGGGDSRHGVGRGCVVG